jgi:hypothetical protein
MFLLCYVLSFSGFNNSKLSSVSFLCMKISYYYLTRAQLLFVGMPHRKWLILFCSYLYMYVLWCASVDVGMAVRICGFNRGFGSVASQ